MSSIVNLVLLRFEVLGIWQFINSIRMQISRVRTIQDVRWTHNALLQIRILHCTVIFLQVLASQVHEVIVHYSVRECCLKMHK